jgi:hypothetical protein
VISIPFAEFPFFTQDLLLDGAKYRFLFLWNTRASKWSLSIYTTSDAPLVEGIPVALDQEMLGQYHSRGIPPGELWAVDATGTLVEISRDDLAKGLVQLVYVPEDEL